jgi:CheY-like chemotaxis protein
MALGLDTATFARRKLANPLQVARDGQEALDFIDRWDTEMPLPAVILLDLKLPKTVVWKCFGVSKSIRVFKNHPSGDSDPLGRRR